MWRSLWLSGVFMIMLGCASTIPESIRTAPTGSPTLPEVRQTTERFVGTTVRWGGSIAAVRNLPNETRIEMVSRRLNSEGRPYAEDQSDGRFILSVGYFLDPAVYAVGRELTVRGVLQPIEQQPIGEYVYAYAVVRAEQLFLWPQRVPEPAYRDPLWWDPWYPWGWPYYYVPPHRW